MPKPSDSERAGSSMVEQYPLKVLVGSSSLPRLTESNSAP